MAEMDDVISTLTRGWARAEHDAGALPESWAAGARERIVSALGAYGVDLDADVERIAAIHWDGQWMSILRDEVIEARNSRDPMWRSLATLQAHDRRVQAAIAALEAFRASCQPRG